MFQSDGSEPEVCERGACASHAYHLSNGDADVQNSAHGRGGGVRGEGGTEPTPYGPGDGRLPTGHRQVFVDR
jgi:hypothetical protein